MNKQEFTYNNACKQECVNSLQDHRQMYVTVQFLNNVQNLPFSVESEELSLILYRILRFARI
jgi:hypothetical protein